jgi:hypothetical protein
VGPRGWENDKELMSRGKMKNADDSDGEYPDMHGWEEADDEDESTDEEEEEGHRRGKSTALRSSNLNDINFEKTMAEYDEKEIGYLSEVRAEMIRAVRNRPICVPSQLIENTW